MRNLIVSEFISLDGVIQAPGGKDEDTDGGFAHGGWTWPFWDDAIGEHFGEAMSKADALLLGRRTWQIHGAAFNPMPVGDPFGDMMNNVQKYVASNTLTSTELWRNSEIISGDVLAGVRKLKDQQGKDILIDGSSVLVQALAENDLVDEYALHVYPVVLGGGKRIFPEGKHIGLNLVDATPLNSGVVFMRYRRG